MPKRLAFVSDLHLGQKGIDDWGQRSLLSQAVSNPGVKVGALKSRIDALTGGNPYTLVLAGDALDLSLAYLRDALQDMVEILKVLAPEEVIWVIGNHDHHLFMLESEKRRSLDHLAAGRYPEAGGLYRGLDGPIPLTVLQALFSTEGVKAPVLIAYPTLKIELDDKDGAKVPVFVNHGHLFGGLYTLMTDLIRHKLKGWSRERVAATVNAPLIEFIYWLLGETGEGFGADGLVEQIYMEAKAGKTGQVEPLIGNAVERLLPEGIIRGVPDAWERSAVKALLLDLVKRAVESERGQAGASSDRHEDPAETRRRLDDWMGETGIDRDKRGIFVYGHTHVADRHVVFPSVTCYNLGSWLQERGEGDPDAMLLYLEETPAGLAQTFERI